MNYCAEYICREPFNVSTMKNWESVLVHDIGKRLLEGRMQFLHVKPVEGITIAPEAQREVSGKGFTLVDVYFNIPGPQMQLTEGMLTFYIQHRLYRGRGSINCIQPVNN